MATTLVAFTQQILLRWSKTGIDTYNALAEVIAKQHLNVRNMTILTNVEPNLRQNFAEQQAAEPQKQGMKGCKLA
jgi:hypothetical protein